ncbi:MAG: GDP-mannose 4,6-dehydratase, partial [Bdellovibrionota bacterium]
MKTWLITGVAGFIGSNFVRRIRARREARIVNLDKLTYAGHMENLEELHGDPDHIFIRGDIADSRLVAQLLKEHQPDSIVNFAAESHVDRSILDPLTFIETNVIGTQTLLQCALDYWRALEVARKRNFRFLHVSTDEVYGSLESQAPAFTENHPYKPNSPYAASK